MRIRVEVSSLATKNLSGVASYTKSLVEALDTDNSVDTYAAYFNFLNRQPQPNLLLHHQLEENNIIPLRVYAKLQSYGFVQPFDLLLPKVDLTIFPNFATWPAIHTKYRATVIHDLTYLYFPETTESKNLLHLRRVVPRSIKEADFVIAVSETVKNELIKEFSLSPEKCIVTTIPPDKKYYQVNTNEIHKKYHIPTKKFIYFMGNLEPRKDLPTLIEAYCKLPSKIKKDYSLVIAGGNGWITEASHLAIQRAQAAGELVVRTGFINSNDTAAFYQQASVFVMPSIYEGFGIPILEAMASGCPVIASNIPVLHETAGQAALFAKTGDSDSFCGAIKKLLLDPSLQKKLIIAGKKHLNSFSWNKNIKKIINQVNYLDNRNVH